jgi:uncharacterized membrane-anchored protein YhcB (DUF1043 family)
MHIGHYIKDVLETVALVGAVVGFFIGMIVAHFVGKFRRRKNVA